MSGTCETCGCVHNRPTCPDCAPKADCYACAAPSERMRRMFLCPTCGNKRCPKATHHDHACTGSNEPDQHGSRFGTVAPLEEKLRAAENRVQQLEHGRGASHCGYQWGMGSKNHGGGCEQAFNDAGDVYRCLDCGGAFHKACLRRHFASHSGETREALAEKLRAAEEALKDEKAARFRASVVDVSMASVAVVRAILEDLTDRRGLRQQWWQIDSEIQDEIRSAWVDAAAAAIRAALPAETKGGG